jgi:hypothetical protein
VSDEIAVESSALRAQAAEVERVGGAVDYARDAARSMNLTGGAFGLMCAFLVPTAVGVTQIAANAMAETAAMLQREADALRAIADDFENTEKRASDDLRALSTELGAV